MSEHAVAWCTFTHTQGVGEIRIRGEAFLADGRAVEFSLSVSPGILAATLNTAIATAAKDALSAAYDTNFDIGSIVNIVGGTLSL